MSGGRAAVESTNGFLGHTGSDGSTFLDRISAAGFTGAASGEVLAQGYATGSAVTGAWLESAPHCAAVTSTTPTRVGVAYVADGSYWAVVTGRL